MTDRDLLQVILSQLSEMREDARDTHREILARLGALEQAQAYAKGRGKLWVSLLGAVSGFAAALIAAVWGRT